MKNQSEPVPVKPSEVKKAQKAKVKPEITKEECQENLNKVEKMLHKDGINITHDEFEQKAADAFAEDKKEGDEQQGWAALIPTYYAFEWCAEALKALFGGARNNTEPDQANNDVPAVGEPSSNPDHI
jgi:hypothetical protein